MKKCSKCRCSKPPSDFYVCRSPSSRVKDGLQRWCQECSKAYSEEYNKLNREKARLVARKRYWEDPEPARAAARAVYHKDPAAAKERCKIWSKNNPLKVKAHDLKKRYGISITDYNRLLESQGGVCAICKTVGGKKGLGVDHCHETGGIRGLLCSKCNTAIGLFNDSKNLLSSASDYLTRTAPSSPIPYASPELQPAVVV